MANECPFCKIAAGELPAKKIYENETVVAFLDINPRSPGHTLVIPKEHYETLFDVPADEAAEIFHAVKIIADAVKEGSGADGLSLSQSNYRAAGQIVPHLHFHLIPRFNSEGPAGLEAFMPAKKIDEESMEKIAGGIKEHITEKPAPSKPAKKPAKKEEQEEDEDIDFDF